MLGRFLELSIATPDIAESLAFYETLGFSQAQVGDAWPHPYAVVTDGRICLGLHQEPSFETSMTFVKQDLLKHLAGFESLGLKIELRRLAGDAFNELGWRDPGGHLIRLVEARTFSPVVRGPAETSRCGYFVEIALPALEPEAARAHWERCGFVGLDEPDATLPHVSCTSDSIDIGLYAPTHVRSPMLVFEAEGRETPARLTGAGIPPDRRLPAPLAHTGSTVLTAPEGTVILIVPNQTAESRPSW
jgi:catechol 2,3-dioxygenase-like lactoylglutathione lyase family enzyme